MNIKKFFVCYFVFSFYLINSCFSATLTIDPTKSSIMFKIQHHEGYTLGYFEDFAAEVKMNDNNTQIMDVKARINAASINTQNQVRDEGLRSPMFFDAGKFPQATFEMTKMDGDQMSGNLTIKGNTKPIILTTAVQKDPQNSTQVVLAAKGTFNRHDFGITYNEKLSGKVMKIGDQVELTVELNGTPQ